MNENLKEAKLKFAIGRKNLLLTLTEKDVVVGKRGMFGHKCQEARDKFAYEVSRVAVEIDNNLLQLKAKKITSSVLKQAVKETAENNNIKGNTLSA